MNRITIIGNLVREPEQRATPSGVSACTFTVAVNRRFGSRDGERETDFFRVTAWRGLADTCARYLSKGSKVAVIGDVRLSQYTGRDGNARAQIEINASDVEFLSARSETAQQQPAPAPEAWGGFDDINGDQLSF